MSFSAATGHGNAFLLLTLGGAITLSTYMINNKPKLNGVILHFITVDIITSNLFNYFNFIYM